MVMITSSVRWLGWRREGSYLAREMARGSKTATTINRRIATAYRQLDVRLRRSLLTLSLLVAQAPLLWAQADDQKVLMVLDISVHDSIAYEQYRAQVEPMIVKYGGKYLVRSGGMSFETDPSTKLIPVEGEWNPDRLIILQWDSMDQLRSFSSSEEYKRVAQLRENAASTRSVIVKEYRGSH